MSSIELELNTGAVKPEGGKSSALYQNPASMHFECFLDIKWKTFFLYNDMFSVELDLISGVSNPKGETKRPLPESGVDAFLTLSRHLFIDAAIYK